MGNIRTFKLRTYGIAFFVLIIFPGIVISVIWMILSLNLLNGIAWAISEYAAWFGVIYLVPRLLGASLKEWLRFDTLEILKQFDIASKRSLRGIKISLPIVKKHIKRKETFEIISFLKGGKNVILTGESGSGKSGVAATIGLNFQKNNIPILFLDTRNYSNIVKSFSDLQDFLNVDISPRKCIEKVANQVGELLVVIDQIDSTIGTPASQVSLELLAHVALNERIYVLAVGCILPTPDFKSVQDLSFIEVVSQPIDRDVIVASLLHANLENPPDALLSLCENLFYLSIFLEIASTTVVEKEKYYLDVRLLDSYFIELDKRVGGEYVQIAIDLANATLQDNQFTFPLPRTDNKAIDRLLQLGWLVENGYRKYRFRHEQLHYYLFAKNVIEKNLNILDLQNTLRNYDLLQVSIFLLKIYFNERDERIKKFLEMVFTMNSICYFSTVRQF